MSRRRGEQRAAARGGRECPVCGKPIEGKRSTRRFCSVACRVKFHRDAGKPSKKQGLRPGQVRILQVLAKARGPMNADTIAEHAGVPRGHLGDLIGLVDWRKREAREARTGIVSLLTLGYVRRISDRDNRELHGCFRITPHGRFVVSGVIDAETQRELTKHAGDPVDFDALNEEAPPDDPDDLGEVCSED
jgi:hypothetical protein